MQQSLLNFCKCFGPVSNSPHQNDYSRVATYPHSVKFCRCSLNGCSTDNKIILICCDECVFNGAKDSSKPTPTRGCQVSCAEPQKLSSCCCAFRCPICLIRRLCQETWDAYRKGTTIRERYSIFEGGPSLTSNLRAAKTKTLVEYGAIDERRPIFGQSEKGSKKPEGGRSDADKKAAKQITKARKDKYRDFNDDVSKMEKKRRRAMDISKDKLEVNSRSVKKGSKLRSRPNQAAERKLDKGNKGGKYTFADGSDDDLQKSEKNERFKKGRGKKERLVDKNEDDEPAQNNRKKLENKTTKTKSNVVNKSNDDEILLKGKGKMGEIREEHEDRDKESIGKNKIKNKKLRENFQDGDQNRAKRKNKGGQVSSITDDEGDKIRPKGKSKSLTPITSEDEHENVQPVMRGQKAGKGPAKYKRRNEDVVTAKEKSKGDRRKRVDEDSLKIEKFSQPKCKFPEKGIRKDVRDDVDWAQKNDKLIDQGLIDRIYREKMEKLNVSGRKLTSSDYMRIRLEQRFSK